MAVVKIHSRAFGLTLITLLLLISVGIIFYLSWLPEPRLSRYGFLPDWLARWTDADVNDNLRTAVPLVFLGFLTGCWLAITNQEWRWWLYALLGSVSIVIIAEVGQLTLPHRNFDWGDVAWGAIGSLVGLGMTALSIAVIQLIIKQTRGL